MIVQISYNRFKNLAELLHGYIDMKIGWGILSADLMDIECNCNIPYKVKDECVYEGKCKKNV